MLYYIIVYYIFTKESVNKPHNFGMMDDVAETPIMIKGNFPPSTELKDKFTGRDKGIQGHHNSCYMDSTLFAMFAFSEVFDGSLHRHKRETDVDDYEEAQETLRNEIVNPLRWYPFVIKYFLFFSV